MTQTAGTPMSDRDRRPSSGARAAQGLLGLVGTVVRFVTGAAATVLVLHILLTVLGANPLNGVTRFFATVADALTLGLANLFVLANPALQVVVSYGVPAIVWLVIGSVIVAILRRLARPRSGLR
jgi:hypothetical protein